MRIGTVAVLLCLLCSAGCRRAAPGRVFVEPALESLVPPDTTMLAGLRLDKLRDTPAWNRILAQRLPSSVDRFAKDTGLDPRKDLWQFLVAGNGKDMVVFCRGKFSEMGLEPKLNREGAQRFTYRGYTLMGDERAAVTFMNSTTAIAGPARLVRSVLDRRDSGGIPKALAGEMAAIPAASQIWIAGDVSGLLGSLAAARGNSANAAQFAAAIDHVAGGADFSKGMHAEATVLCRTPDDATRVNGAFRAAVGIARLNTRDNERDTLRAFDGMKSDVRDGRSVDIRIDMGPEQLDALFRFVETMRPPQK